MIMTLLFMVLMNLFEITSSETKMILIWGVPESKQNVSVINRKQTWDDCIKECYFSPECVMASKFNESCLIYNYNSMTNVVKTTSENGSIVAFKVNSPDDKCPIGINPPTFDNQNATGTLYVNKYPPYFPFYVTYNIYFDEESFKFSYRVNRSCRGIYQHYIEYKDGSGKCFNTIFANDAGSFSYERGVELCKINTPYLAGLVEKEDFEWLEQIGQQLRSNISSRDTYARIDGVRTTKCRSTPKTAECMSPKGFEFNGPPVPHFNNYKWITNSSAMETNDSNCLVMVFKGKNEVKIDVRECSLKTTPLKTQLIFCSNTAWIYNTFDYD